MIASLRKTFSGAGRKRKDAPRKPCGRLVQKKARTAMDETLSVVLAQPHRKGSADQRRRWAIGRLILDGKVRHSSIQGSDLERAAELYAKAYANMRWVWQSSRPYAKMVAGSGEPTKAEADAIKDAWSRVNRTLRNCGERIEKAAEFAILDDPQDEATLAPWIILSLPTALEALVRHYGLTVRAKPCSVRN